MPPAAEDRALTTARVAANIRRFSPQLDPRNPDHQQAYRLARQTNERPSLNTILAILDTMKKEAKSGAGLFTTYLLVPKSNFTNKVAPDWLQPWIVDVEELQVPGNIRISAC